MTQRDLTPYTCPGGMLLVRARHAGPPRSNQPLEHAPHLHTCARHSSVRVLGLVPCLSTTLTVTVLPPYWSSAQVPQL